MKWCTFNYVFFSAFQWIVLKNGLYENILPTTTFYNFPDMLSSWSCPLQLYSYLQKYQTMYLFCVHLVCVNGSALKRLVNLEVSHVVWWYCYFLLVSAMVCWGILANKCWLPSLISRSSEFWVAIAEAQTEPPIRFKEKATWTQDTRRTSRQVTQQKPSSMLSLQLKQYKIQDAIGKSENVKYKPKKH